MNNYYRKYIILKSHVNRGRSAVLRTEKKNGFVKINLSYDGKEVRDNLYLLGFNKSQKNIFKIKTNHTFDVKSPAFEKSSYFAIILEKHNACSLEYLEKEKEMAILSAFEKYRFYTFSTVSHKKANKIRSDKSMENKVIETNKVFEKSSTHEIKENSSDISTSSKIMDEKNVSSDKESASTNNQNNSDTPPNLFSSFQQASKLFSTMNMASPKANQEEEAQRQSVQPKTQKINPFMNYFPNSEWIKTQYQGRRGYWHYLSGKIYDHQTLKYKAIAVPGEYAVTPPSWLEGFNKYYISNIPTASGYWIMFLDPETGKTVDPPD